jgi:hypothetical protein
MPGSTQVSTSDRRAMTVKLLAEQLPIMYLSMRCNQPMEGSGPSRKTVAARQSNHHA